MSYLFGLIFFVLGLFLGSFGAIQVLIILFFSIPTTIKFKKEGAFKENAPLVHDLISVCVISLIFFGVSFVIVKFFSDYQIAYWIGVGIVVLMGLGQIGNNTNNMNDYLSNNKKYFAIEHSNPPVSETERISYLFHLFQELRNEGVPEKEALMQVWGEIKIKQNTCLLKNEYGYAERPLEAKKALINQVFEPLDVASYDIYKSVEFIIAWEFYENYNNMPTVEDIRAGKNDALIIEKK